MCDNRSPCESQARGKIKLIGLHQPARCAALPCINQFAGGEIKVRHLVFSVVDRSRVVIAKSQVQGESRIHLEVILNESAIGILAVVKGATERNIGGLGIPRSQSAIWLTAAAAHPPEVN